ncbi:transcriptional adapter 2-beta isoform X1 [Manis pentadactyla]|uniref:transcriptional adapter 2-beta isoform X1 n=1 Tax=Manis pentadactyla TaxID=143292 RepID=UPI00255CAB16|nr:transcriptional adapter 2-beta isoform X1 [Manis pentadactyla]
MAELGKKYCVYCLAEVSPLRFRCTECQDIELCPECFSAGAEIGHHRRYHGYQLVDGGRFTLWGPEAEGGWTSREEQLLLDAIEQFGFGNWVFAECRLWARPGALPEYEFVDIGRHGCSRRSFPDPPGSDGALCKHVHPRQPGEGVHPRHHPQPGDRPHLPQWGPPLSQPHHPLASPRHLGGRAAAAGLHAAARRLRGRVRPGRRDAHQRALGELRRRGRGGGAQARARGHVRAQAPRAAAAQEHRAGLQPGARLPGPGAQGPGEGGQAQGLQGGARAAPQAAAALPVHVLQGVRRPVREHAQGEAAARQDPRAAALPAQRHHQDGGVGRVRGGAAQAREAQGEQGRGGRQARPRGRQGRRVRRHREPARLRAAVGPREGAVQLAEPEPRALRDREDHHHQGPPAEAPGHPLQKPPAQLSGQGPKEKDSELPHGEWLDIQGRLLKPRRSEGWGDANSS